MTVCMFENASEKLRCVNVVYMPMSMSGHLLTQTFTRYPRFCERRKGKWYYTLLLDSNMLKLIIPKLSIHVVFNEGET